MQISQLIAELEEIRRTRGEVTVGVGYDDLVVDMVDFFEGEGDEPPMAILVPSQAGL
jgi:hypothetical protein